MGKWGSSKNVLAAFAWLALAQAPAVEAQQPQSGAKAPAREKRFTLEDIEVDEEPCKVITNETQRRHCELGSTLTLSNHFVTTRALGNYVSAFGAGFLDELRKLGPAQHWVDLGSGESYAAEDYFLTNCRPRTIELRSAGPSMVDADRPMEAAYACPPLPAATLAKRAKVTGVTLKLTRPIKNDFGGKFRVLKDRFYSEIPDEEIGRMDLVTDVYGVFSYTTTFDADLAKTLRLLNTGGKILIYGNATRENNTIDVPDKGKMRIDQWLETIKGLKIERIPLKGGPPSLVITKVADTIVIPRLTLLTQDDDGPPARTFAQSGGAIVVTGAQVVAPRAQWGRGLVPPAL